MFATLSRMDHRVAMCATRFRVSSTEKGSVLFVIELPAVTNIAKLITAGYFYASINFSELETKILNN